MDALDQQNPATQLMKNPQPEHTSNQKEKQASSSDKESGDTEKKKMAEKVDNEKLQPRIEIDEAKILSRRNNLFGDKQSQNKSNIFSNQQSINLFSSNNSTQFTNIFAKASQSQPVVEPHEDEDSEQLSQSQDLVVQEEPPKGQMKYDYGPGMQTLGQFKLIVFRAGSNPSKQSVEAFLQTNKESKDSAKILYLIVRNPATKLALFQGIVLEASKPETFMNRPENLRLFVMRITVQEQKNVREKELVKMQFQNQSEAQRFTEILLQHFKESNKSTE